MSEKQTPQIRVERFEFLLTVNDNIICQRYFKINDFNEYALGSLELKDALDYCVSLIDNDLKSKSRVYIHHMAPNIFNSKEEMYEWAKHPNHTYNVRFGESFFVKGDEQEYWWDSENQVVKESQTKTNDGEFINPINETDPVVFKFTFLDNGREVYSKTWDGTCYPKFVRNSVDLSNKKGKVEESEVTRLNFDNSLLYHMVCDKSDLVSIIIKEICDVCSEQNKEWFTTSEIYDTTETIKNEDGTVTYKKVGPQKRYSYSLKAMNKKYYDGWDKYTKKKSIEYSKTLY